MQSKSEWISVREFWRHDKLHLFIIGYYVLLYSWMYRVALRAFMDGAPFRWVTVMNTRMVGDAERRAIIAGNGTDGHFLIILLLAMFATALLYLIIRRPDSFTKTLFLGWVAIFFAHQCTLALQLGEDYIIRGDTMGLVLPFYVIGPLQHGLMLLLALVWILRKRPGQLRFIPLDSNRISLLRRYLAGYAVIFILFRLGEQHALTDQLGIIGLYALTIALLLALFNVAPADSRERDQH